MRWWSFVFPKIFLRTTGVTTANYLSNFSHVCLEDAVAKFVTNTFVTSNSSKECFYHTENVIVIESICFSFLVGIFGGKRILWTSFVRHRYLLAVELFGKKAFVDVSTLCILNSHISQFDLPQNFIAYIWRGSIALLLECAFVKSDHVSLAILPFEFG